ncbi:hypothetical protein C8R47DRAFT_1066126 [Mycena vitilis]|nr:hypothetical protein C8R47DRAFT_1066126 [Mycena vitilis]
MIFASIARHRGRSKLPGHLRNALRPPTYRLPAVGMISSNGQRSNGQKGHPPISAHVPIRAPGYLAPGRKLSSTVHRPRLPHGGVGLAMRAHSDGSRMPKRDQIEHGIAPGETEQRQKEQRKSPRNYQTASTTIVPPHQGPHRQPLHGSLKIFSACPRGLEYHRRHNVPAGARTNHLDIASRPFVTASDAVSIGLRSPRAPSTSQRHRSFLRANT